MIYLFLPKGGGRRGYTPLAFAYHHLFWDRPGPHPGRYLLLPFAHSYGGA